MDPALRQRKTERNLVPLHLEEAEQPDDQFTLLNVGCAYLELVPALHFGSLDVGLRGPKARFHLGRLALRLGQPEEAKRFGGTAECSVNAWESDGSHSATFRKVAEWSVFDHVGS